MENPHKSGQKRCQVLIWGLLKVEALKPNIGNPYDPSHSRMANKRGNQTLMKRYISATIKTTSVKTSLLLLSSTAAAALPLPLMSGVACLTRRTDFYCKYTQRQPHSCPTDRSRCWERETETHTQTAHEEHAKMAGKVLQPQVNEQEPNQTTHQCSSSLPNAQSAFKDRDLVPFNSQPCISAQRSSPNSSLVHVLRWWPWYSFGNRSRHRLHHRGFAGTPSSARSREEIWSICQHRDCCSPLVLLVSIACLADCIA